MRAGPAALVPLPDTGPGLAPLAMRFAPAIGRLRPRSEGASRPRAPTLPAPSRPRAPALAEESLPACWSGGCATAMRPLTLLAVLHLHREIAVASLPNPGQGIGDLCIGRWSPRLRHARRGSGCLYPRKPSARSKWCTRPGEVDISPVRSGSGNIQRRRRSLAAVARAAVFEPASAIFAAETQKKAQWTNTGGGREDRSGWAKEVPLGKGHSRSGVPPRVGESTRGRAWHGVCSRTGHRERPRAPSPTRRSFR